MNSYRILIAAIVLLSCCGPAPATEAEHEAAQEEHAGEIVLLDADEIAEFGVVVREAGPAVLEQRLELPAEIHPDADRLAHIVPRYEGVVTGIRADIGDAVTAGQVLAVVESDGSLAPYDVTTLIAGTVIDRGLTLGEAVSRERAVFTVADLSRVWVDITVYQRDLDRVRIGQEATIGLDRDAPGAAGVISYVTPVLDETTRTATARVVLPNPDGAWRPGMFAAARIVVGRVEAPVAVPESALQTWEGDTVVFVETPEGFRPRPVTTGARGGGLVALSAGLAPGERYVAEGGFTLKAELGKDAFGHDHAH